MDSILRIATNFYVNLFCFDHYYYLSGLISIHNLYKIRSGHQPFTKLKPLTFCLCTRHITRTPGNINYAYSCYVFISYKSKAATADRWINDTSSAFGVTNLV